MKLVNKLIFFKYSDEDEEHFTDVKLEDSDSEFPRSSVEAKTQRPAPSRMVDSHTSDDEGSHKKGTSWVHRKNLGGSLSFYLNRE